MFWKSVKTQIAYILQRKTSVLIWYTLCGFITMNFLKNVIWNRQVVYISQMFDLTKEVLLSGWSKFGHYFMLFYPILVVIPTSTLFLKDRSSKNVLYLSQRLGKRKYYYSKALAAFSATFLLFTIPFLLELLLSVLCFHISSKGDPSNFSYYQSVVTDQYYPFGDFYIRHRIWYVVIMIGIFGIVSGILAVFNLALASLRIFRFQIFTLLPVYFLLEFLARLAQYGKVKFATNYYFILRMFSESSKDMNLFVYAGFLLLLLFISIIILTRKGHADELS